MSRSRFTTPIATHELAVHKDIVNLAMISGKVTKLPVPPRKTIGSVEILRVENAKGSLLSRFSFRQERAEDGTIVVQLWHGDVSLVATAAKVGELHVNPATGATTYTPFRPTSASVLHVRACPATA